MHLALTLHAKFLSMNNLLFSQSLHLFSHSSNLQDFKCVLTLDILGGSVFRSDDLTAKASLTLMYVILAPATQRSVHSIDRRTSDMRQAIMMLSFVNVNKNSLWLEFPYICIQMYTYNRRMLSSSFKCVCVSQERNEAFYLNRR